MKIVLVLVLFACVAYAGKIPTQDQDQETSRCNLVECDHQCWIWGYYEGVCGEETKECECVPFVQPPTEEPKPTQALVIQPDCNSSDCASNCVRWGYEKGTCTKENNCECTPLDYSKPVIAKGCDQSTCAKGCKMSGYASGKCYEDDLSKVQNDKYCRCFGNENE